MKDLHFKINDLSKSFKFVQTGHYIFNVVVFDQRIPGNSLPPECIFELTLKPTGYLITSKKKVPNWIESYKVIDLLNSHMQ